jgi:Glycosyl transferases group 1
VLIEAMANGTPVIAFGRGSVPEIIDHGITGFIVDSVDEAVAAIPLAKALDRGAIRRRFEEQFSVERMARGYVALYGEVLRRGTVGAVLSSAATAQRDGERCLTPNRTNLTKPVPAGAGEDRVSASGTWSRCVQSVFAACHPSRFSA